MKIVVLADESLKTELLAQGVNENVHVEWVNKPEDLLKFSDTDIFIDLLFQNTPERIKLLQQLSQATFQKNSVGSSGKSTPVLVNAVNTTLSQLPAGIVRMNGWNSFLKRPVIEASGDHESIKEKVVQALSFFNKTVEWVPDLPGFVSARVVAMIINEAYFTLQGEVSTKEEIDTAMKLGTNYPYGPFEWGTKIGLKNVYELLATLAKNNKRYEPAALLKKEVLQ